MLLQLEEKQQGDIDKLLLFAEKNNLKLSLIDDQSDNYLLPGKPLSDDQLKQLIQNSRKSGLIFMKSAHDIIRNPYGTG